MKTISTQPETTPNTGLTVRRVGQISYLVMSTLFALALLLQVFLAGGGIFASLSWDSSPWLAMHRVFGNALSLFPVALIILALVGRQSWRRVGLNGLLLVLVALQGVLITVPESSGLPFLEAFHLVNALLIFGLNLTLLYTTWQDIRHDREQA